jgi:hypothetical protein
MRLLALMLCLVVGPVWAIDDDKISITLGAGAVSCGEVVEQYSTEWDTWNLDYTNYINGYISAYNYLKVGKANWSEGSDTVGRLLFVVNSCKEHPLGSFKAGVVALMREFDPAFGHSAF